ncbi:MAG: type II secretion system protein [Rickettsiales bacterium]
MKHGFSLVELSIVLVILGLLVGGILSGQSLIRAAELRSVSSEYSRWVAATQTFRDKYFSMPGDMNNATSFWGAAHATPATCLTTVGTGTQTCNGDANGSLSGSAAASQYGEWYTFWQHLANAGLIEGTYSGIAGSGASYHLTSTNSPKSKLATSGLWMLADDASSGAAMFPGAVARHNFRLGGVVTNSWPASPLLKPEEMWNIDTKMDDGKPGTGKMTSQLSTYIANCSTTAVASTADYMLTYTSASCLAFMGLN